MTPAHHMKVLEEDTIRVEVLDKNDHVLPELIEIFKIVAKYDIILDLNHTGTKERFIMTEEAQKYGVKKILLDASPMERESHVGRSDG